MTPLPLTIQERLSPKNSLQVSHNHAEKLVGVQVPPCWSHSTALWSPAISQPTKASSKCKTHVHREAKKNTRQSQKMDRQTSRSLFSVLWTINATQHQAPNNFKLNQLPQSGRNCQARTEHTVGAQLHNSYCKSDWRGRVKRSPWSWNNLKTQVSELTTELPELKMSS